jgi:primosomal protein N''
MESHPEEFRVGDDMYRDRWDEHISDIQAFGNAVDTAALDAKLRDIRLGEIHERVMDELCNGEERHRKKAEENEYERNLAASVQHMKQQQARQHLTAQQQAYGQYQNALSAGELSASLGQANQAAGSLSETINRLKQALGAKK